MAPAKLSELGSALCVNDHGLSSRAKFKLGSSLKVGGRVGAGPPQRRHAAHAPPARCPTLPAAPPDGLRSMVAGRGGHGGDVGAATHRSPPPAADCPVALLPPA